MQRRVFLDDECDAHFKERGFVRLPLLTGDEVEALKRRIDVLRPDDSFAPEGRRVTFHCSFLDTNKQYRRQVWDLLEPLFRPIIDKHLSGFRALQCNIYVKPPGRGYFIMHQNWPALDNLDDTSLTLWCPLVDADETNGVLRLIPGSHKLLPHVQGPESLSFLETVDGLDDVIESLPFKAGEGVIFDDSLLHGSEPNRSDDARFALQLILVPEDAVPTFHFRDGDDRFELIEADTDFWLSYDASQLLSRQPEWKSLGFVANRNRRITPKEFKRLLSRRPRRGWAARTGRAAGAGLAQLLSMRARKQP